MGLLQDNGWPPSLNRKDATAFIRAVKRYGLEIRLPQIAAEIGPVMEEAPEDARWGSLLPPGTKSCVSQMLGSDCGGEREWRTKRHTPNRMSSPSHGGCGLMHLSSAGLPAARF